MPDGPMVPSRHRITSRVVETADTVTLGLEPVDEPIPEHRPGQFSMLYAFGAGEVPISVSACPGSGREVRHTIRSRRRHHPGAVRPPPRLDGRGPRPVRGGLAGRHGRGGPDTLVVGGGIGLAPLRPVVHQVLAERERFGQVAVLAGARTPSDVLYQEELTEWREGAGLQVEVTIDVARGWAGHVGLVTSLLESSQVGFEHVTAFLCGPEVMMRVVARALIDRGADPSRIFVSLERNMHCAVRLCGHCQLGPMFVCAEGPVLSWASAAPLLAVRRW